MNLKELTKYSKDKRLEFIDLKFTDIPGLWQHITIPIQQLDIVSLILPVCFLISKASHDKPMRPAFKSKL